MIEPVAAPPVAARLPHQVTSPFGAREDPYYWMRDDARQDPRVLGHLAAENAYAEAVLAPARGLEEALFAEMRARIQEDDASVPVFDRGYWYYVRHEAGRQYPIYARRAGTLAAAEQVLLDGNALAAGHAFHKLGGYAVSPDGRLLAYAEDTVGRNQFVLRVKDLETGALRLDTAANVSGALAWAADSATLFYGGKDEVTLRADRVYRLALGGAPALVHHEPDGQFYVGVATTKSRRYVVIGLRSTTSAEALLIDAAEPTRAPRVFIPRAADHLYGVDHVGERFIVRTNDAATNFRVVEVPLERAADRATWIDLIPHRPDVLVESVAAYDTFLAASVRAGGLRKVEVRVHGDAPVFLDAEDPAYVMSVIDTPDPHATAVRYAYEALARPPAVYELELPTRARALLKQQPVPTYEPSRYASAYAHARAADGARIPISIVHHVDTPLDGTAPLLVYGYGSYGLAMEPSFSGARVSLLDRGWVYAIAHVRGGQELGRAWYEAGKLQHKRNSFTDFIAATEHLVAAGYGARGQVFAMGGSAGGLLVGAVANLRPELYRGVVAFVPFVDVVTTMLDETIPLTTNEYDEWGHPGADAAAYAYMLSYSPYDNVAAQAYPAIYCRTGLWDSQVQYWEPAKWIARLRATKRDANPVLLDTNLTAGHGGASGRFDALREVARAYAFVLHARAPPAPRGWPAAPGLARTSRFAREGAWRISDRVMRAISLAALAATLGACGPTNRGDGEGGGAPDACSGLECRVAQCEQRGLPPTTISGKVFAPNGTLALYGASVYVPLSDPGPLVEGAQCNRCQDELPGGALANATSGTGGEFTLSKVPSGRNVPLVIQIGKWRRRVDVTEVLECQDNPLPAELTRLPRNATEGDLPKIAISTGGCDALECLVRKLGVDVNEFTAESGAGRVHLFAAGGTNTFAGGATATDARAALWSSLDKLKKYDVALFSCQCGPNAAEKTQAMMDNVKAYADLGGRVFLSHYHAIWIDGEQGVPTHAPAVWPEIAVCEDDSSFTGTGIIDQVDNPKGAAFASWMQAVMGSTTNGQFPIMEGKQTCSSIDTFKAERWVYRTTGNQQLPQNFQFTTPNEAEEAERCGKVVFSDMHVASGSTSSASRPFPQGCATGALTPQEKALAFMLFDISTCVGPIF